MSPRSIGRATWAVLGEIHRGTRYGLALSDATGFPTGTVYPALTTLERRGLVVSTWEDEAAAHADGRPRRRIYQLTESGRTELRRHEAAAAGRRESRGAPESGSEDPVGRDPRGGTALGEPA